MSTEVLIAPGPGCVLSHAQHTVLDEAVNSYIRLKGLPCEDELIRLVFAGRPGKESYQQHLPHGSTPHPELALLFHSLDYYMHRPDMVRMSAVLTSKEGQPVITGHEVHDQAELENRVVMLEIRWNENTDTVTCPLTGMPHTPFKGYVPFLKGTQEIVDHDLMPERVFYTIAQYETVFEMAGGDKRAPTAEPLVTIAVTAGELRAERRRDFQAARARAAVA